MTYSSSYAFEKRLAIIAVRLMLQCEGIQILVKELIIINIIKQHDEQLNAHCLVSQLYKMYNKNQRQRKEQKFISSGDEEIRSTLQGGTYFPPKQF